MKYSVPIIKMTLAILFLLCLLNMPYGYYQLIRFLALIGFFILAYKANQENKNTEVIIFAALALLLGCLAGQVSFSCAHFGDLLLGLRMLWSFELHPESPRMPFGGHGENLLSHLYHLIFLATLY